MNDIEYSVQPKDALGRYYVHKFVGCEPVPSVSYTVWCRDGKMDCNCPSGSYRGFCKHKDMVKEYRKREKRSESPFDLMMFFKT